MNKEQLEILKRVIADLGFSLIEVEQRITSLNNEMSKGSLVITYQARINYETK